LQQEFDTNYSHQQLLQQGLAVLGEATFGKAAGNGPMTIAYDRS
jgi:hypothetical protein